MTAADALEPATKNADERQPDYRLIAFGGAPLTDNESAALAELHKMLLPHSPVVLMGRRFADRFYYRKLAEDGAIFGAIAYIDEQPAGFIVATPDPEGFMPGAVRRHWPTLVGSLFMSVVTDPRSIGAMVEAVNIQRNVSGQNYEQGMAELLSFGVLKEFRSAAFMRKTGIRLSPDLVNLALSKLEAAGATSVRAVVDQDNIPAKLFYRSQGWTVGASSVEGWKVPTMEFIKVLKPASDAQDSPSTTTDRNA